MFELFSGLILVPFGASPLASMKITSNISVPSCPLSKSWRAAARTDNQSRRPATETLGSVSTQEPGKIALFGTQRTDFFPFANTISWFYTESVIQRCLTWLQLPEQLSQSARYLNILQQHLVGFTGLLQRGQAHLSVTHNQRRKQKSKESDQRVQTWSQV